jgi:hypothetical protein
VEFTRGTLSEILFIVLIPSEHRVATLGVRFISRTHLLSNINSYLLYSFTAFPQNQNARNAQTATVSKRMDVDQLCHLGLMI